MKTLILNGSPRKSGDTASLLEAIYRYLPGEIDEISAYYDGISPCTDCRICWDGSLCPMDDRMKRVIEELPSYDNTIIASPIYFSNLSGMLLAICSRLQFLWVNRVWLGADLRGKKKKGAILLTGGGDGSHDMALKSAKIILRQLNAKSIGEVLSLSTNELAAKEDATAIEQAISIARKLSGGASSHPTVG